MATNGTPDTVRSFGRYASGTSIIFHPRDLDDMRKAIAFARQPPCRRIAIRGGGHSFDAQALHDGDTGEQVIISTADFQTALIEFDERNPNLVRLGAGVTWRTFVAGALGRARERGEPLRLPGSMQTGGGATVGGTLAGDCLSRFSALGGKESEWIESFKLLLMDGSEITVTRSTPDNLFNAVVGGHGYIGIVTEATYRLVDVDRASCARTEITTHTKLRDMIDQQLALVRKGQRTRGSGPRAVSSAWFNRLTARQFQGAVFDSTYVPPQAPPRHGFPIYADLRSDSRYTLEQAVRIEPVNFTIHEYLFALAAVEKVFENDLADFIFFMDGNTFAKERFEKDHHGEPFPIIQQSFVVGKDVVEAFTNTCLKKLLAPFVRPTECDMLFVRGDECLMSGNYQMDGFAVTFAWEPTTGKTPPKRIVAALQELSRECLKVRGRVHLVKNVHVETEVFRQMFSPQIETFEQIKRRYDPELLLQNTFSDRFFKFSPSQPMTRRRGRR